MGVTLVDATGRRTRFRPHPRRGFDQVVDLAGDGFRIEVTGIAIREVTITIRPSSALAARLRLVGAMAADVGRLGIRRRNLRTLFEMMRAGDWSGIGRRLDARYRQAPRGTAPGDSVIDAATWSHRFVELDDADRARLNDLVAARPAPDRPTVTFVLDATFGPDPAAATATIATQRWPHHDSTVLDGSLTLDEALDGTVGDWVVWLDPYGRLHEAASYAIAEAADRHPDAMVLVADGEQADDDDLVTSIRCNPPWNPDLVLGGDGAGPLVAVRRDAIGRLLPDSGPAAPTVPDLQPEDPAHHLVPLVDPEALEDDLPLEFEVLGGVGAGLEQPERAADVRLRSHRKRDPEVAPQPPNVPDLEQHAVGLREGAAATLDPQHGGPLECLQSEEVSVEVEGLAAIRGHVVAAVESLGLAILAVGDRQGPDDHAPAGILATGAQQQNEPAGPPGINPHPSILRCRRQGCNSPLRRRRSRAAPRRNHRAPAPAATTSAALCIGARRSRVAAAPAHSDLMSEPSATS